MFFSFFSSVQLNGKMRMLIIFVVIGNAKVFLSPHVFFCFSLTRHFPQFASFSCSLFNREMLELCSSGEIKWSEILVERNNDVNEAALSEGRSIECGKSINSRWNNWRFYSQYSWWWWWAQKTADQKSQIHWDLFLPSFAIERSIRRTSMKSSQFNIQ